MLGAGHRHGGCQLGEGPVFFVLGTLLDPLVENGFLFLGESHFSLRWGHDILQVIAMDGLDQPARLWVTRHDASITT